MLPIILLSCLFLGCNSNEYDIFVVNQSTGAISFEFTTGYRTDEYYLSAGETWSYSLLKTFDHAMKVFNSRYPVAYKYSDNIYTFEDAYIVTFHINAGKGTVPSALTAFEDESVTLPKWEGFYREFYRFRGWNVSTAGTETNYTAGSTIDLNDLRKGSFSTAVKNSRKFTLYAKWE